MLLKALVDYAKRCDDLAPRMYLEMPIKWYIDLDVNGNLRNIIRASGAPNDRKDRGIPIAAPHALRPGDSTRPKLLADNAEYVLGFVRKGGNPEKVKLRHAAFKAEVHRCAMETKNPRVKAVDRFLTEMKLSALNLDKDLAGTDNLTFRVADELPIEIPEVRTYWSRVGAPDDGRTLRCLLCNNEKLCLKSLPVQISGGAIPDGNSTGTALISANENAFESFGLERSLVAPICLECGESFVKAINRLAHRPNSHLRLGKTLYLFWTKEKCDFDLVSWFDNPDPAQVHALLESAQKGNTGATMLDPQPFYAVALTANVARIAVRDWVDTTVGEVQIRICRYFRLQQIASGNEIDDNPFPMWRIASATIRKGDELIPGTAQALLALALKGTPLPYRMLAQVIHRIGAESRVRREHAALIKMILLSQDPQWNGGDEMVELNMERREPAYLCGRLLAVLEALQDRALNVNAGIVERFGGAASASPKKVFPSLLKLSWAHLGKLEKSSPGAHQAIQKKLEEVLVGLQDFPATLTLQEQGIFFLGYYHQRAYDRAQAIARKEAKQAAASAAE